MSLKLQGLTNLGHDEDKVRASVAEELIERMASDGKDPGSIYARFNLNLQVVLL